MKKTGFTLIEVMIVIVIVGVLVTIAIPKISNMSSEARFVGNSDITKTQAHICIDYMRGLDSDKLDKLIDKINNKNYTCENYLETHKENTSATIQEKFMSGTYSDEEKDVCLRYMNANYNDPDLGERFTNRVNTDNFTCEVMSMNRRHASQVSVSTTIVGVRYQIMNDETVIFYTKDAKELFNDMEEVKAKMTMKNIKGIVQTENGALVTYGY